MKDLFKRAMPFIASYATYVALIHAVPGPWRAWKKAPKSLDTWTLTHLFWGALAQRMGLTIHDVMALGTVNEAIEAYVRLYRPDLIWGSPETARNVMLDLAATGGGWYVARALGGSAVARKGS